MDFSKLSDEELDHIANNRYEKLSDNTLNMIANPNTGPVSKPTVSMGPAPVEEPSYSPEGIPLVTPSNIEGPGRVGKVLTDVVSMAPRAAFGIAEPFANIANLMGYGEPKKALQQMDVGMKAQGPNFMGVQSPLSSTANIAGELGGGNALLGGLGKAIQPVAAAAPFLKPSIEAIKASKLRPSSSVLGGAVLGAAGSESQSPMDIAKEALYSAGFGALGHGAASALGAVMDPELARIVKLKAQGLLPEDLQKLSVGQLIGGGYQKLENFLRDVPFSGAEKNVKQGEDVVKNLLESNKNLIGGETKAANTGLSNAQQDAARARQEALDAQHRQLDIAQNAQHDQMDIAQNAAHRKEKIDLDAKHDAEKRALDAEHVALESKVLDKHNSLLENQTETESKFHTPMINKALEPLGAEVPENLKGRDAIKWAQDKISETYNKALPKLAGIDIHAPEFIEKLKGITDKYKSILGDDYFRYLKNDVNELLNSAKPGEGLDPQKWQDSLSDLSNSAYRVLTTVGATTGEIKYGNALKDLKNEWMDLIEGKVGSEEFKAANRAHSMLQAPQKASTYMRNIGSGEFSPEDLVRAIKSSISEKRFAGGTDEIQKMAEDAYNSLKTEKDALKNRIKSEIDSFKNAKSTDKDSLSSKHGAEKIDLETKHINEKINLNKIKDQNKINLANKKITEKQLLDLSNTQAVRNVKSQQLLNENLSETKRKGFENVLGEVADTGPDSYLKRRLGFMIGTGSLGAGAAGGAGLASAIGLSPMAGPLASALTLAGSQAINSKAAQNLIKKGLMAERPEAVKRVGKALKENAPISGLAAVEAQQQSRQNKKKE